MIVIGNHEESKNMDLRFNKIKQTLMSKMELYEMNTFTNYNISYTSTVFSDMTQTKSKIQKNKNNKIKPANLLKKEYLESYEELKRSIKENQKA